MQIIPLMTSAEFASSGPAAISVRLLLASLLFCFPTVSARAQPAEDQAAIADNVSGPANAESTDKAGQKSVESLVEMIKKSLVIVRATGRDGRDYGHGTGFVVSGDGLIATARHVIGDRRAVRVELADGTLLPVTKIHAVTEAVDLAVLQVDSKDLTPLPLNTDSQPKAGQPVVSVGYPGSTQYSVFSGMVNGGREIDGVAMLQLAMNVEPGSSGEPVVDRTGRVIGIVTLKSTELDDVGFAVPVDHLNALLKDPTPIPMERWMTIGALDPKQWEVLWGANWRQRASRILVDGYGDSFGGRSLCLQTAKAPPIPFEVQVDIKLDNENGAAGLAFHADGGNRHYGFYPSAGNARLTRFNGPELDSWTILHNESHPAYRPGEWNTFKVRIEADRILCYVNDQLALESDDHVLPPGRIGLATFRGTSAGFRRFQFGDQVMPSLPGEVQSAEIASILKDLNVVRPATPDLVSELLPFRAWTSRVLEDEAQRLEQKAKRVRQLAADIHAAGVRQQIVLALGIKPTAEAEDAESAEEAATTDPDLLKAALLIAVLDNEEIEPDSYIDRVAQLADEVRQMFPAGATEEVRLAALDKMLFSEYGFRGSRYEYYTRSNSYLNEVIDDREGLPITLSVLYMELAKQLDLKVVGLGLPGHFVVRFEPSMEGAEPQIIDVFDHGKRISQADAEQLVRSRGFPLIPAFFAEQSPAAIIRRMLDNLLALAERNRDDERVLRYLDTLVAIDREEPQYRAKRLEIRARTGRLNEAIEDADWFIDQQPEGTNTDRLYELRSQLQRQLEVWGQ